jgi:hypothetical protein
MKTNSLINAAMPLLLSTVLIFSCQKENLVEELKTQNSNELKTNQGRTNNSQSIMVDIIGASNFTISNEKVYEFYPDDVLGYFVASGGNNETVRKNAIKNVANNQKCIFWDSDTYGVLKGGKLGQVTVSLKDQANNKPEPETGWKLISSAGSDHVDMNLQINVAGEFFIEQNKQKNYSFKLGKAGFYKENHVDSRVKDLVINLFKDGVLVNSIYPSYEIITGTNESCLTYNFYGNAGNFGNCPPLHTDCSLPESCMSKILEQSGNFSESAIAKLEEMKLQLGEGQYKVSVTGKIRNNVGEADSEFKGDKIFSITAGNCAD